MNLTVLLVDDEINIVQNLKQVIPWEEMGIEVIGLAQNGVEALEYITEDGPDLLFTDIRMPVMDGITLLQRVREVNRHCDILILTGYQDFEYARSALQYGAKDYILKPINYGALEATVKQLSLQIRTAKMEKLLEVEKWGRVKSLAYEKMLLDMIIDYSSTAAAYSYAAQEYDVERLSYLLILADIDQYSQKAREWNDKERKLWHFAVKNVLIDVLDTHSLRYVVLQIRQGEWTILIEQCEEERFSEVIVKTWATALQQAVLTFVKLEINICIYPKVVKVMNLAEAYEKAQRTLQLSPQHLAIWSHNEDEDRLVSSPHASFWSAVEHIVIGLKQSRRQEVESALDDLKNSLLLVSEQSSQQVDQILHYLILHLLREIQEMNMKSKEFEQSIWHELEQSADVKDLIDLIGRIVDWTLASTMNKQSTEMMMLSARDYIDRNLSLDLGIEELADFVGISCSYFSQLFKQHFSETFLEYLTRKRMEMAMSMLVTSEQSVAQIGRAVGYEERRYFTRVFQKYSGLKPSEYRANSLKG